ncbi:unnamed protein product [Triticum turgidum subsp. durum]|uniref:F-box/LRR-repeat protein n=1 Tax=Triticum turgidum subsp. durum TaxID=4567 RepID=A0A9R1B486_TRITD|nr:unnamed protein product [Triticum turgidum subsp. durum]
MLPTRFPDFGSGRATCSTECTRRQRRAASVTSATSPTTSSGTCCPFCLRLMLCRLACSTPEDDNEEDDDNDIEYDPLVLDVPLISQHLKILHLNRVDLKRSTLNFSRCSVLEELEMQDCYIDARRISSKSLKRLCITDFCSFPTKFHIRIFAPGLISLQLDNFDGLTPSLEYMPSLETAYIWLDNDCYHLCRGSWQNYDLDDCSCHAYPVDEGVLLHGLSNAVNLELIADIYTDMFIYSWDLKYCPVFDKLETLLINEWFTTIDLLCILQHSPILETLTLQLGDTKELVRATGAQEKIEQSFVCSNLKVVNIECTKVDEGVDKILKILSTCGILRDQISITEQWPYSDRFSFQKPLPPLPSTAALVAVSTSDDI